MLDLAQQRLAPVGLALGSGRNGDLQLTECAAHRRSEHAVDAHPVEPRVAQQDLHGFERTVLAGAPLFGLGHLRGLFRTAHLERPVDRVGFVKRARTHSQSHGFKVRQPVELLLRRLDFAAPVGGERGEIVGAEAAFERSGALRSQIARRRLAGKRAIIGRLERALGRAARGEQGHRRIALGRSGPPECRRRRRCFQAASAQLQLLFANRGMIGGARAREHARQHQPADVGAMAQVAWSQCLDQPVLVGQPVEQVRRVGLADCAQLARSRQQKPDQPWRDLAQDQAGVSKPRDLRIGNPVEHPGIEERLGEFGGVGRVARQVGEDRFDLVHSLIARKTFEHDQCERMPPDGMRGAAAQVGAFEFLGLVARRQELCAVLIGQAVKFAVMPRIGSSGNRAWDGRRGWQFAPADHQTQPGKDFLLVEQLDQPHGHGHLPRADHFETVEDQQQRCAAYGCRHFAHRRQPVRKDVGHLCFHRQALGAGSGRLDRALQEFTGIGQSVGCRFVSVGPDEQRPLPNDLQKHRLRLSRGHADRVEINQHGFGLALLQFEQQRGDQRRFADAAGSGKEERPGIGPAARGKIDQADQIRFAPDQFVGKRRQQGKLAATFRQSPARRRQRRFEAAVFEVTGVLGELQRREHGRIDHLRFAQPIELGRVRGLAGPLPLGFFRPQQGSTQGRREQVAVGRRWCQGDRLADLRRRRQRCQRRPAMVTLHQPAQCSAVDLLLAFERQRAEPRKVAALGQSKRIEWPGDRRKQLQPIDRRAHGLLVK